MMDYGTNVVAGVTPGKGGEWVAGSVPSSTPCARPWTPPAPTSRIIFVPARFAPDAILEAADAGIELVVCITEGIPALDMMQRARLSRHDCRPA